mgnify:CR=1 FL=1
MAGDSLERPRLAPSTWLVGRLGESALANPPWAVERARHGYISMGELAYHVAEQADGDSVALPSEVRSANFQGGPGVGLALLSAICFGAFFVLNRAPSEESVAWTVMLIRLAPVPVLVRCPRVRAR